MGALWRNDSNGSESICCYWQDESIMSGNVQIVTFWAISERCPLSADNKRKSTADYLLGALQPHGWQQLIDVCFTCTECSLWKPLVLWWRAFGPVPAFHRHRYHLGNNLLWTVTMAIVICMEIMLGPLEDEEADYVRRIKPKSRMSGRMSTEKIRSVALQGSMSSYRACAEMC